MSDYKQLLQIRHKVTGNKQSNSKKESLLKLLEFRPWLLVSVSEAQMARTGKTGSDKLTKNDKRRLKPDSDMSTVPRVLSFNPLQVTGNQAMHSAVQS